MKNILTIDNALSKKDFSACVKEIEDNNNSKPFKAWWFSFSRWHPKPDTVISNIIEKMLWSKKVTEPASKFGDLSWKWFVCRFALGFEVQVTSYKLKNHYKWHVDHADGDGRILNYILYMTEVDGGELEVCDITTLKIGTKAGDKYHKTISIKPKKNRLVIIPTWIIHRVNPVKTGNRITINGHIKI